MKLVTHHKTGNYGTRLHSGRWINASSIARLYCLLRCMHGTRMEIADMQSRYAQIGNIYRFADISEGAALSMVQLPMAQDSYILSKLIK